MGEPNSKPFIRLDFLNPFGVQTNKNLCQINVRIRCGDPHRTKKNLVRGPWNCLVGRDWYGYFLKEGEEWSQNLPKGQKFVFHSVSKSFHVKSSRQDI